MNQHGPSRDCRVVHTLGIMHWLAVIRSSESAWPEERLTTALHVKNALKGSYLRLGISMAQGENDTKKCKKYFLPFAVQYGGCHRFCWVNHVCLVIHHELVCRCWHQLALPSTPRLAWVRIYHLLRDASWSSVMFKWHIIVHIWLSMCQYLSALYVAVQFNNETFPLYNWSETE